MRGLNQLLHRWESSDGLKHLQIVGRETKQASRPTRGQSAPDVTVKLALDPEALMALAEALGEIAADLWLDGEIDLD